MKMRNFSSHSNVKILTARLQTNNKYKQMLLYMGRKKVLVQNKAAFTLSCNIHESCQKVFALCLQT